MDYYKTLVYYRRQSLERLSDSDLYDLAYTYYDNLEDGSREHLIGLILNYELKVPLNSEI